MGANSDSKASSSLFPDSGASFHVTNNSQNIQQTSPFEGADQIFIGNGKEAPESGNHDEEALESEFATIACGGLELEL